MFMSCGYDQLERLPKGVRKKNVMDRGRNYRMIDVLLVRRRSEDMKSVIDEAEGTDFARYWCSVRGGNIGTAIETECYFF